MSNYLGLSGKFRIEPYNVLNKNKGESARLPFVSDKKIYGANLAFHPNQVHLSAGGKLCLSYMELYR